MRVSALLYLRFRASFRPRLCKEGIEVWGRFSVVIRFEVIHKNLRRPKPRTLLLRLTPNGGRTPLVSRFVIGSFCSTVFTYLCVFTVLDVRFPNGEMCVICFFFFWNAFICTYIFCFCNGVRGVMGSEITHMLLWEGIITKTWRWNLAQHATTHVHIWACMWRSACARFWFSTRYQPCLIIRSSTPPPVMSALCLIYTPMTSLPTL